MKSKALLSTLSIFLLASMLLGCNKPNSSSSETLSSSDTLVSSSQVVDVDKNYLAYYDEDQKIEKHDYLSTLKYEEDDLLENQVTLKEVIDGDTLLLQQGNRTMKVNLDGIRTPESTGVIERWGKSASNYVSFVLKNAKTIVTSLGGVNFNNTRSLYIWTSSRSIDEEDGTELRLLNLDLVEQGFARVKEDEIRSEYKEIFLEAQEQAKNLELHIHSSLKDSLFDEPVGKEEPTQEDIYKEPGLYKNKKVLLEGIITRVFQNNCYIQRTFEDPKTNEKRTYGIYTFLGMGDHKDFVTGTKVRVVGHIAEQRNHDYYLSDVQKENIEIVATNQAIEENILDTNTYTIRKNYNVLVTLNEAKVLSYNLEEHYLLVSYQGKEIKVSFDRLPLETSFLDKFVNSKTKISGILKYKYSTNNMGYTQFIQLVSNQDIQKI